MQRIQHTTNDNNTNSNTNNPNNSNNTNNTNTNSIPRPIIRIYGTSAKSLKSYCVNIHNIYPYLYFRPEDIHDNSFDEMTVVER